MMLQKLTQTYKIASYQGNGCHNSVSRDLILWFVGLGRTFRTKCYFHIQNVYTPCVFKMKEEFLRNVATIFPNYTQSQSRILIYTCKDRKTLMMQYYIHTHTHTHTHPHKRWDEKDRIVKLTDILSWNTVGIRWRRDLLIIFYRDQTKFLNTTKCIRKSIQ